MCKTVPMPPTGKRGHSNNPDFTAMRKLLSILRTLITALLLPLFALSLQAQKVTDVSFEQVGDQVRITYRLDAPTDIQVFLSTNGGISYGYPLKAVQGDVGYNVAAGYKTIIWSPLQETDQIVGDNIVFKVVPTLRNTTYNNPTPTPIVPANPTTEKHSGGKLPGKFSVAPNREVQFAQGNLQYQASTRTWRFAEHQWDVVGMGYGQTNSDSYCYIGGTVAGSDNSQISSTYGGWIDLFGWGTGNAPTKSSEDYSDYQTFVDWGRNAISNGGNQANMWRTLTKEEWVYMFVKRPNAKQKYGAAKVNGVTGVVLLPDYWTLPSGCGFTAGMTKANSEYDWSKVASTNIYSTSQWQQMESAGAVFLPCAGYRNGALVVLVGSYGLYWSSSQHSIDFARILNFYSDSLDPENGFYRNIGFPVRLVSGL